MDQTTVQCRNSIILESGLPSSAKQRRRRLPSPYFYPLPLPPEAVTPSTMFGPSRPPHPSRPFLSPPSRLSQPPATTLWSSSVSFAAHQPRINDNYTVSPAPPASTFSSAVMVPNIKETSSRRSRTISTPSSPRTLLLLSPLSPSLSPPQLPQASVATQPTAQLPLRLPRRRCVDSNVDVALHHRGGRPASLACVHERTLHRQDDTVSSLGPLR